MPSRKPARTPKPKMYQMATACSPAAHTAWSVES